MRCQLLLSLLLQVVVEGVKQEEVQVLAELFRSTGGVDWRWRGKEAGAQWDLSQSTEGLFLDDPCSSASMENRTWQGVTCSASPMLCSSELCHITEISLEDFGLSGYLPSALGNLSHLQLLSVSANRLTGTIPPEVGDLGTLKYLSFYDNQLTNSIPSRISDILTLTYLDLDLNLLSHEIPQEISNMSNLFTLYIGRTSVSGNIPQGISKLLNLRRLAFYDNLLSGPVSSEIGLMTRLEKLHLYGNYLSGTLPGNIGMLDRLQDFHIYNNLLEKHLPNSLGSLNSIVTLYLYDNLFTGAIPSELQRLPLLEMLSLNRNDLSGSIPGWFGQITTLKSLNIFDNHLTGSFPLALLLLTNLENLALHDNRLTGSIPSDIGSLHALQHLYLYSNYFTGSLPRELVSMVNLKSFVLYENLFTGGLPSDVGKLYNLEVFSIYDNSFTGSIPESLGNLTNLNILHLRNNLFLGTIPYSLGMLSMLKTMYFTNNDLTGTIPTSFQFLKNLDELWMSDNFLTGTIPNEISNMSNIRILALQNNAISGVLNEIFINSSFTKLEIIDFSNNIFSGPISGGLFNLPKIKVLSLSVNCFTGSLSKDICNSETIEVLSLNGLGAAENCDGSLVIPMSGVRLYYAVDGTLPLCIWDLRNLSVLHITGNGLSGEIKPTAMSSDSRVMDISLSHNKFTGETPSFFYNISNMDLSYNRFSGEFNDQISFSTNTNVNMIINRLSGHLPVYDLYQVVNGSINLLQGNLFSCKSIPENDEYFRDYVCGSQNFNEAIIIFASICGAAVLILLAIFMSIYVILPRLKPSSPLLSNGLLCWNDMTFLRCLTKEIYLNHPAAQAIRKLILFSEYFEVVARCACRLLLLVVGGCSVLYIIKLQDSENVYSTHSRTYSWFWTLAYMRGQMPAGVLLGIWAMVLSVCFWYIYVASNKKSDSTEVVNVENKHSETTLTSKIWPAFVLNVIITAAVNVFYIYSTQQDLAPYLHFLIQLGLSVYRICYVAIAFPILSHSIRNPHDNIRFRFSMLALNNLFIPCIVASLTSDSCFKGLLVKPDSVSTPYAYSTCEEYITPLSGPRYCTGLRSIALDTATLQPPFTYNNQCGSVIITSYVPVFLLGYSLHMVLLVIAQSTLLYLPFSAMSHSVRKLFHGIIWPMHWLQDGVEFEHNKSAIKDDPYALLKTPTIFCNDVLHSWLLMLTFGLCSPILALAILFAVLLKMSLWIFLLGRFTRTVLCHNDTTISNSENNSSSLNVTKSIIKTDIVQFAMTSAVTLKVSLFDVLKGSFWIVAWTSAIFIACISWDISTDDVGWLKSIWIPIFSVAWVVVLQIFANNLDKRVRSARISKTREKSNEMVTLTECDTSHNPLQSDSKL